MHKNLAKIGVLSFSKHLRHHAAPRWVFNLVGAGEMSFRTPRPHAARLSARSPIRGRFYGSAGRLAGWIGPICCASAGPRPSGASSMPPLPRNWDTALQIDVVNMGVMNGGLDVLSGGSGHRHSTGAARRPWSLQITGAQTMTNRFYAVHPRRNDRFIKATPILRTIFRDVDFHRVPLHPASSDPSPPRCRRTVSPCSRRSCGLAWLARMSAFLRRTRVPVHLLWLSRRAPGDTAARAGWAKTRFS